MPNKKVERHHLYLYLFVTLCAGQAFPAHVTASQLIAKFPHLSHVRWQASRGPEFQTMATCLHLRSLEVDCENGISRECFERLIDFTGLETLQLTAVLEGVNLHTLAACLMGLTVLWLAHPRGWEFKEETLSPLSLLLHLREFEPLSRSKSYNACSSQCHQAEAAL